MEERLRKFVQLVDAGNFTKASRELHVSQPALSVSIAKLERELRASLIAHGVRPLTLTAAGQLAYSAGKDMQAKTSNLKTQLAELAERPVAVSIGMIDSVASTLLTSPDSMDELERNASVSLVVDNSRNLLKAVENGELNLAFVTGQRHYNARLEIMHQATEVLAVVCHPDQLVQVNRSVQSGTLPRFMSYDQASATQRFITDGLQQRGIVPKVKFYSTSPDVMLHMVLLKRGVAALPYSLVQPYLAARKLTVLGEPAFLLERPIVVVKRRDIILPATLVHAAERVSALLTTNDTRL